MRYRLRVLAGGVSPIACSQEGEKRLIEGLGVPQDVKAVLGEDNVTLSWDAVVGARSYSISYDTKSAARRGKGLSIGDSPADVGNVDRVLIEGLQPNVTYYLEVATTAPDGDGPASPEISVTLSAVTAPPAAPKNLQARVGNGSVALAWDASETAGSYRVYYGSNSGTYDGKEAKEGASPVVVSDSFGATLTGLTNGEAYYFVVSGVNSKGESGKSAEIAGTPTAGTMTGAVEISAGGAHTCARLSDKSVKCWGRDFSGQLGDGTTVNRLTPVQVQGLP